MTKPICAALLVAAFTAGCDTPAPGDAGQPVPTQTASTTEIPVASGATIRGTVRFHGEPPAPAFQPVDKDQGVCGAQVPVTRLALGADAGVAHAFVFLENAPATGALKPRESVAVEQSRCEYGPRALTVQSGTRLDIANDDPILHNVHARRLTSSGLETIFNIAQPIRGQRTVVDPPLTSPGIVALSCEAGHPWMSAYVLVADHPYTAVTDADGRFAIENVPAGTYRIRMWHEGVRLTQVLKSVQRYEFEAPYEVSREVVVPAAGETVVDFDFELRPTLAATAN